MDTPSTPTVLALSGGIGGAKLALGLYTVLAPWDLGVTANTGDDLVHMGLHVSPDVDTLMYTLSGENNAELGWGRAGETWTFMDQTKRLGGPDWFNLGDGDLALHVRRTDLLNAGRTLSEITAEFFAAFGVAAQAWPMSDDPVRTLVETADGRSLPFQNYFVQERCAPEVRGFTYAGAETAAPNPKLIERLGAPGLRCVVLCPSNPFVSIEPILAVPGIRDALKACPVPVVAVSPLVGGAAVKGPLGKMFAELGRPADNSSVLAHYADFLDGFVIDETDASDAEHLGLPVLTTPTVMRSLDDRARLAEAVLAFADDLAGGDAVRAASGGG